MLWSANRGLIYQSIRFGPSGGQDPNGCSTGTCSSLAPITPHREKGPQWPL